jgi:tight adherence protein C
MIVLLLIGILLVACSVALYLQAYSYRRRAAAQMLAGIGRYGFQEGGKDPAPPQLRLLPRLDAFAVSLGTSVAAHLGSGSEEEMQKLLRSAGVYGLSPRKLLGYRLLAAIGLPLLWLLLASGAQTATLVLGFVFALLLGWQGPVVYLRRRSRFRLEQVDYQMPELIDVLVTTVEAGVGFSGSLQLAAQRFQGALGQELRLTLTEQEMGLSTEEALQNMLERADTPAMRSFVRSVLQGETLGVSIGKILRDLAEEMRKRRRQRAEERAQKAPTKILFPLVFLIFPAMFVVLLGPAIISIIHTLKGV